jgi:hypothetical protein
MSDSPNQPAAGQPESESWILLTEDTGESAFRIDRLRRLARAAVAAWPETAAKVSRVHDHKGHLSVIWNEVPSDNDAHTMASLWATCGEPMESVEHFAPRWSRGAGADKELRR